MPLFLCFLLITSSLSAQYRGEATYVSESGQARRVYFDKHQSRIDLDAPRQYLLDLKQERLSILDFDEKRGHSQALKWLKEKGPTGRECDLLGFHCLGYEFWDNKGQLLLIWLCPDLPASLTPGLAQTRGGIVKMTYADGRTWTLSQLKQDIQFFPIQPFEPPAELLWHWEAEEDIPALKHIDFRAEPRYRRK